LFIYIKPFKELLKVKYIHVENSQALFGFHG